MADLLPQTLAPALTIPVINESVLPILAGLVGDAIPNIRFNVAKSYSALIDVLKRLPDDTETMSTLEKSGKSASGSARGDQMIREAILPSLDKLISDEDIDVRYFASVAAKSYSDAMQT